MKNNVKTRMRVNGIIMLFFLPAALGISFVQAENPPQKQAGISELQVLSFSPGTNVTGLSTQQVAKTISGKITDQQGEPLPGVTIVVKGTTIGTVTNIDGNYNLTKVPDNATLVFSFVGMKAQEIAVNGQAQINVLMEEETIGLEEVVAIGYGTMKKRDLTGAISSVGEDDISNEPIQRMEQVLQGRVSGVTVTTTSGSPDGSIMIRVRGANSINGGNDPLYIIDGVANSELFKLLDVNDIQSIEVLKDASATAIYGSRGANGVILVTTKKGTPGRFDMQFETQQSWGNISKSYDMLDAVEYADFYNEYRKKRGATDDFYSEQQIGEWRENGGLDWQDLIYQIAYTQNYKLSVSGGDSKIRCLISSNVREANGILIGSKYKRYGIRANIDAKTFNWLNINFDVNATHSNSIKNGGGGVIWDALIYSPTIALYDEDGNWGKDNVSSYYDNPYGRRVQDKDENVSNYFGSNLKFTFDLPVEGLTVDILGSANYFNRKSYALTSAEKELHPQNSARNRQNGYLNWQNTNQITYVNNWAVHRLTATIIAEYMQQTSDQLNVEVNNLLTESVGYWNLGLGEISSFDNNYSKSTLASYIGRVMYQLKDKYLFTATIRRDGSSKFQGDNKWGYFPSGALSWRASEEPFIKRLNIFDQFKIRTSWGVTGNQGIGAYSTLGMLSRSNYSWGTSTVYPGYWAANTSTPGLTWEKTYQWDAGLDLGFFKNRLIATIDLYLKNTKDLLLEKSIPYYNGGGSVYQNLGHVRNKGLEISLNIIPLKTNNLNWESTVNLSYSKNKVIDMGGDERLFPGDFNNLITFNPHVLELGKPMGSLWGYTWLGLWNTDETDEAALYGQSPGDNKFLDKNEDYTIDSNDQGIIGKAFPDYTFGWNNTITWKNFEFNVFFQGAVGADRLNLTRYGISEAISDARFVTSKEGYCNMWTIDNQNTNIPNIYSTTIDTNAGSTQYMESADFVRLKNFSVGYNVPIKNNSMLSDIKISASVQNLFTVTGYSGYDPEITSSGASDIRGGIEEGAYPLPRTITMGLRINF